MSIGSPITGSETTVEDAVARIALRPNVSGVDRVPLSQALFRILAEDIIAAHPVPGHDSAAVDGYAFRLSDLQTNGRMLIVGRVAAGHPFDGVLPPGAAVQIFTGGVIPEGADTVAMQEDSIFTDREVVLPTTLALGANRRLAGEDVAQHAVVLARGLRLRPQDIGMAAAVGQSTLPVYRRVRVAVIATGDELRGPGEPLPRGCIYDSNRHALVAALNALGAEVVDCRLLADKHSSIKEALLSAADKTDLVITIGGVSVGDEDHVRKVVQEVGSLDFWRLPIKPGRPVAIGDVAGVPLLALPGNPVSAMVTFWLLGRPLLLRLMGATELGSPRFQVVSAFSHRHIAGRREFLRVRVRSDSAGPHRAQAYPSTSSGMLSSLTWSDGLVEVGEQAGDIKVGDLLSYLPYNIL